MIDGHNYTMANHNEELEKLRLAKIVEYRKQEREMNVKERVELEKKELDEKIEKLEKFINGEGFLKINQKQKTLLKNQLQTMTVYSTILELRLQNLEE